MFEWPWGEKSKIQLGVDIGSSSIKIMELTREKERAYVTNYAMAELKNEGAVSIIDLGDEEIVKLLELLIKEAKLGGRRVNVSLPVEKTFSTIITLPLMPENELAAAVFFEAQKYVPISLNEVELDWSVISDENNQTSLLQSAATTDSVQNNSSAAQGGSTPSASQSIQVLLLAVPKETISRVVKIMKQAGFKVTALEQEAFSLARALIGNDKNVFLIIDLGRRGTDLIVLDGGSIKLSHNLDSINKEIILMEINRIVNLFQMRYNKRVGQCLLVGGRANEKELFDFLSANLKMPVKTGNPFARVGYEKSLTDFLKELAPQFAVAVGLAMREN